MTNEDIMYMCSFAGIYPAKYDSAGWVSFLMKLSKAGIDVSAQMDDIESMPKNRKEMENVATEVRTRMSKPQYMEAVSIDADQFVTMSEDKKDKEFNQFVRTVEWLTFPPCVGEVDPVIQNYIKDNYMYTFADDGSPLVYCRVMDTPGTIWEECKDSAAVFLKTRGEMRNGLIKRLVVRSLTRTVTVFYTKNGEQQLMEHVPYWKLHRKYYEKAMSTVKGSPENVAKFATRYNDWIEYLKRCNSGDLNHAELERGMQEIPKKLRELDESILDMTFFYHKRIDLPDLTNDPNKPAFAYFDLSSITEGPTPDFDGFMSAIHPACRDSLMAAIYGTFFEGCHLNQYVWLHGEGGDGKSSLLNAIAAYAGERLACSLGQTLNSEFGLEDAVGKRMVILSDVKTGLSVKSQLIHNLTGHDMISINRKNKPIISVRLNPIVWIAANESPDVNFDNRNEARRCLYIKMIEPPVEVQKKFYFTKPDGTFELDQNGRKINNGYDLEGNLVKEMPHILYKCREAFNRVCPPPHSVIKQNIAALELAEDNCLDIEAATYNIYIQETFSFSNPEAKMVQTEVFEALAETMKEHSEKKGMDNFGKRDVRRLLTVKYGCKRKKSNGIYYMMGIMRKRDSMEPVPDPTTGRTVYVPENPQFNAEDIV